MDKEGFEEREQNLMLYLKLHSIYIMVEKIKIKF